MYLTDKTIYTNTPAFVSSHHYINRTRTATKAMGTVEDGKTILKAGTLYTNPEGVVEGLVFHDVDLTHAETMPVAVMVEGYVYEDRLPEVIEEVTKAEIPEIKFEDYNATEEEGEA